MGVKTAYPYDVRLLAYGTCSQASRTGAGWAENYFLNSATKS